MIYIIGVSHTYLPHRIVVCCLSLQLKNKGGLIFFCFRKGNWFQARTIFWFISYWELFKLITSNTTSINHVSLGQWLLNENHAQQKTHLEKKKFRKLSISCCFLRFPWTLGHYLTHMQTQSSVLALTLIGLESSTSKKNNWTSSTYCLNIYVWRKLFYIYLHSRQDLTVSCICQWFKNIYNDSILIFSWNKKCFLTST